MMHDGNTMALIHVAAEQDMDGCRDKYESARPWAKTGPVLGRQPIPDPKLIQAWKDEGARSFDEPESSEPHDLDHQQRATREIVTRTRPGVGSSTYSPT
jgi:hypothetical protein